VLTVEAQSLGTIGPAVDEAVRLSAVKVLGRYAAGVRKAAQESMHEEEGPAPKGEPPHVHRGRLKRSIVYAIDEEAMSAEIGQGNIKEALIARKLEPDRPFMQPALVAANERFSNQ